MQKIPLQALPEYDKLSVRRTAAVRLELTFEEKKARVRDFRPIDDVFFEALAVMPGVCEEMLRTILEDPNLTVLEVIPQSSEYIHGGCFSAPPMSDIVRFAHS